MNAFRNFCALVLTLFMVGGHKLKKMTDRGAVNPFRGILQAACKHVGGRGAVQVLKQAKSCPSICLKIDQAHFLTSECPPPDAGDMICQAHFAGGQEKKSPSRFSAQASGRLAPVFPLPIGAHIGDFAGLSGFALAQFIEDQCEIVVGFGDRLQAIGCGTPGLKKTSFPPAAQDGAGKI